MIGSCTGEQFEVKQLVDQILLKEEICHIKSERAMVPWI